MSPNMYSNHSRFIYYLFYLIISHYKPIHGTLSVDSTAWLDDFALDPTAQSGWKIQKISGYDLPVLNPLVSIDGEPKYHGPFPANYRLKRSITCDTAGDTQLWVSMCAHYCNTDSNDTLQFHVNDHSETYSSKIFDTEILSPNNGKLLDSTDLSYVQSTTGTYYTGHESSSTPIPECAQSATWYTSKVHFTYNAKVVGGHEYEMSIEINMEDDTDEYVLLSRIFAVCYQISTSAPIPSTTQTVPPTLPVMAPTTEQPTSAPEEATTTEVDLTETSLSTTEEEITTTTQVTQEEATKTGQTGRETTVDGGSQGKNNIAPSDTTNATKPSADSFEEDHDWPPDKENTPEQPWCQHCAIYVVYGCVSLVICFLIIICVLCILHRREARRIRERKAQMKNEVKVVPNIQHNASNSSDSRVINMQQEVEEDHVEHDGSRDIETLSDRTSQRGSVVTDTNIMRYDEMNEVEADHPDHRKTVSRRHDAEEEEDTEHIEEEETEQIEEEDTEDEYENDDVVGIELDMQGIDGMEDGEEETNPHFMTNMDLIDKASIDHLNMDEYDFVDDSDSPC